MHNTNDLHAKLKEIEVLILEKTNPNGSCAFDPLPVMVSLELTHRMIIGEE